MALNLIFNFEEMGSKQDKATKDLKRYLKKKGIDSTDIEISPIKRTSGISYREMHIVLSDSQTLTFLIKQTGDIFKVKINKKELPIKNQHDHELAMKEVLAKVESGRAAFQKMQAKALVKLPPKMQSTTKTRSTLLEEKNADLDKALAEADSKLAELAAQHQSLQAA